MKIKTITCHMVDNHGANLQAYALMHYLELLGNDVEIIDYRPEYFNHFRPLLCTTPKYKRNPILRVAYICAKFPFRLRDYIKYLKSKRKLNFE
ncbi:MAG: polysaccharide pyruvyl transferase family protein, partial [Eubacterium sp.]|nr:polysaccharide pyruvyl transferase family protein [Eubacterium sp.]